MLAKTLSRTETFSAVTLAVHEDIFQIKIYVKGYTCKRVLPLTGHTVHKSWK